MTITRNAFKRFEPLSTIDGYDVIELSTGRPIDHRDTLRQANGVAYRLNTLAQTSENAVNVALGTGRLRTTK
jgi:hypothetical protein